MHRYFMPVILGKMSTITVDTVKKLAALSALSLPDEAAAKLADELTTILGHVEQLNDVDTDGLQPTYQVTGLENISRADEIIDYGLNREDLLQNAPESEDGSIKVERVLA